MGSWHHSPHSLSTGRRGLLIKIVHYSTIMAADKATFAWRSILLHLANKLKQGEPQKIAFLADLPDKYRTNEISGEDVLERLQMDGFFSTSSSQGLFDIFTDLGRKDLAKQAKERVKEFHSKFGGDGMNNGGTTGSSCHCGRLEVELRSAIMHMVAAEDHLGKLFTPLLLLFSEKLRMQTENGLKHLKQVIWHFKTLYETMRETATPASGFSTSAGIISQDPSKEPNNAIYASPSGQCNPIEYIALALTTWHSLSFQNVLCRHCWLIHHLIHYLIHLNTHLDHYQNNLPLNIS